LLKLNFVSESLKIPVTEAKEADSLLPWCDDTTTYQECTAARWWSLVIRSTSSNTRLQHDVYRKQCSPWSLPKSIVRRDSSATAEKALLSTSS
jgi:hypothetical protein